MKEAKYPAVIHSEGTQSEYFYIQDIYGQLNARLNNGDSSYEILDYWINESFRNQGHGKNLLRLGCALARSIGARAIIAPHIITRESLDAICSVFGTENVDVEHQGDYEDVSLHPHQRNQTKASLYFEIDHRQLD